MTNILCMGVDTQLNKIFKSYENDLISHIINNRPKETSSFNFHHSFYLFFLNVFLNGHHQI